MLYDDNNVQKKTINLNCCRLTLLRWIFVSVLGIYGVLVTLTMTNSRVSISVVFSPQFWTKQRRCLTLKINLGIAAKKDF